ncbi:MAG: hypothetical protein WC653_05900, partial [Candidatus Gracilibacteria bacterium]
QGALLDPRSEDSRVAKEAADFILMKIPVFKGVREKAAVQKAAAQRSRDVQSYVGTYADTTVGQLLVDAENVAHEIHDAGGVTSAINYNTRINDLAAQMENPDDAEGRAGVEAEIRKIYGEMLVDADALRKPEVLAEPLPSEAEGTPGEQAVVQSQPESIPAAAQPEVKEPEINSETDFLASLAGDGWKKYADLTGTNKSGSLVFKGLDEGTPEYIHSRLHHFFGPDGAAIKEADPSKLDIEVDGKVAGWKGIAGYSDGTLVEAKTGKRLWVKNGTKIEWKKAESGISKVVTPEKTPALAETELAARAKEIAELHNSLLVLIKKEDTLVKRENDAIATYKAVREGSRGLLETKNHQKKQVAAAEQMYNQRIAAINEGRRALAEGYEKLRPALAKVDMTIIPEKGNENTLAFAKQIVAYRDGGGKGETYVQRIARLGGTADTKTTVASSGGSTGSTG